MNYVSKVVSESNGKNSGRRSLIWNAEIGAAKELPRNSAVSAISICAKGQLIALGFGDGAMTVLDGVTTDAIFTHIEAFTENQWRASLSPNNFPLS